MNSATRKPEALDKQSFCFDEFDALMQESMHRTPGSEIIPVNGVEKILFGSRQPDFLDAINKQREALEKKYADLREGKSET